MKSAEGASTAGGWGASPKTWLLFYDTVPDYVARRAAFREAHLALAREAHARGELTLAGAFGDEIDGPTRRADGALLVFTSETREPAERFVAADPYVREGLVTRWRIVEWKVVIGGQSS
jgi:uncharacterized protein YciI